jgi:hypothetical protein
MAGFGRRRGGMRRAFRSPFMNIAQAAMSAGQGQDDRTQSQQQRSQKELTPVQAQNISTAKLIVWIINLFLKILPLFLLYWFCVRPQIKKYQL